MAVPHSHREATTAEHAARSPRGNPLRHSAGRFDYPASHGSSGKSGPTRQRRSPSAHSTESGLPWLAVFRLRLGSWRPWCAMRRALLPATHRSITHRPSWARLLWRDCETGSRRLCLRTISESLRRGDGKDWRVACYGWPSAPWTTSPVPRAGRSLMPSTSASASPRRRCATCTRASVRRWRAGRQTGGA